MISSIYNPSFIVAIFYNQNQWHLLVNKCIKPILKQLKDKNQIAGFFLFTQKIKGDHIKLIINPSKENKINFKAIKNKIEIFIKEHPSQVATNRGKIETFFMDFPNNSVLKLNLNTQQYQGIDKMELRQEISKLIIIALAAEEICMESQLTFILYMQLGLIKSIFPTVEETINSIHLLNNFENISIEVKDDTDEINEAEFEKCFQNLFIENKDVLNEIINDIWNINTEATFWMADWIHYCQNKIAEIGFENLYYQSSSILISHLGLPSSQKLTQSFTTLISNSLRNSTLKQLC